MSINPMRFTHQSSQAIHRLEAGRVMRMTGRPEVRTLRALRGAVWITATGPVDTPYGDIWLLAGDEWVLPAGVDAVLEGWPKASVEEVAIWEPSRRSATSVAMQSAVAAVGAWFGVELRRGARLVGIEGPIRMARRAARSKGRRAASTDWGGLYNAGVPRCDA